MDRAKSALIMSGHPSVAATMSATLLREGYAVTAASGTDAGTPDGASPAVKDGSVRNVAIDLDDSAQVAALVGDVLTRTGGLDLIVFCAELSAPALAICPDDGLASVTEFEGTVSRNLGRQFLAMRDGLPVMASAGHGTFITVCSIAALNGVDGQSGFSAASHAMLGLTRAAAMDLARAGVTVNAICLGLDPADPAQFASQAQDAAETALYLASPGARSVTAAHFVIDGGQSVQIPIPADGAMA